MVRYALLRKFKGKRNETVGFIDDYAGSNTGVSVPVMNPIVAAAAVVTSIGTIGGGALYLDNAHVASETFERYLAKERVGVIFDYMDQIRVQGPQPWLCRALEAEIIELCTDVSDHPMCDDRDEIIEESGC